MITIVVHQNSSFYRWISIMGSCDLINALALNGIIFTVLSVNFWYSLIFKVWKSAIFLILSCLLIKENHNLLDNHGVLEMSVIWFWSVFVLLDTYVICRKLKLKYLTYLATFKEPCSENPLYIFMWILPIQEYSHDLIQE